MNHNHLLSSRPPYSLVIPSIQPFLIHSESHHRINRLSYHSFSLFLFIRPAMNPNHLLSFRPRHPIHSAFSHSLLKPSSYSSPDNPLFQSVLIHSSRHNPNHLLSSIPPYSRVIQFIQPFLIHSLSHIPKHNLSDHLVHSLSHIPKHHLSDHLINSVCS